MSLCSSCQVFDLRSLTRTDRQWRNLLAKSVLAAAQGGCSFCGLLVEIMDQDAEAREMMRSLTNACWLRLYFEPGDKHPHHDKGLRIRWLHTTMSHTATPPAFPTRPIGYHVLHVAADEGKSEMHTYLPPYQVPTNQPRMTEETMP